MSNANRSMMVILRDDPVGLRFVRGDGLDGYVFDLVTGGEASSGGHQLYYRNGAVSLASQVMEILQRKGWAVAGHENTAMVIEWMLMHKRIISEALDMSSTAEMVATECGVIYNGVLTRFNRERERELLRNSIRKEHEDEN